MCAVASGLPAGSEGPMAHIGAMSALIIVDYMVKPLFRGYAEWIDDEQTDTDERDYAAIGAGCGVGRPRRATKRRGTFFTHLLCRHSNEARSVRSKQMMAARAPRQ